MSQWRIATKQWTKFFFSMITRLLPLNMVRALFESSMEALHHRGPDFITRRCQPKSGNTIVGSADKPIVANNSDQIGVVIQGPLRLNDNFTMETVRHYLALPNCKSVIVSTWDTEDTITIEKIKNLGAEVVLSNAPSVSGRLNVNKQIVSSREGIRRAIDLGCKYVAKTRSDQRINSLYALSALPALIELFPRDGKESEKQKRLIAISYSTYKWSPYTLCDMFMFGLPEDMMDYWNAPLDDQEYDRNSFQNIYNRDSTTFCELISIYPENYLMQSYMEKIKEAVEISNSCWWKILAKHFIIVDWEWLDVYWPKYLPNDERKELINNASVLNQSMFHADWLNLYLSNKNGLTIDPAIEPANWLLKIAMKIKN